MSDTPRTDALDKSAFQSGKWFENYSAILSFARELERELSAQSSRERKLVEAARKLLLSLARPISTDQRDIGKAMTEVKAALAPYREDV